MRSWALFAALLPLLAGADPKPRPEDYERHAAAPGGVRVGADFHGRGVPGADGGALLKNYVVVEVAVYPPAGTPMRIASAHFSLQIDKRPSLLASSAGEVAMDLRFGSIEDGGLSGAVQAGPAVIAIDRPSAERFPGDPMPGGRPRVPSAPRAPEDSTSGGASRPVSASDVVQKAALDEGDAAGPRAGMIYFRWKDKLTKAKSIVLIYDGPRGRVTLPLKQSPK